MLNWCFVSKTFHCCEAARWKSSNRSSLERIGYLQSPFSSQQPCYELMGAGSSTATWKHWNPEDGQVLPCLALRQVDEKLRAEIAAWDLIKELKVGVNQKGRDSIEFDWQGSIDHMKWLTTLKWLNQKGRGSIITMQEICQCERMKNGQSQHIQAQVTRLRLSFEGNDCRIDRAD